MGNGEKTNRSKYNVDKNIDKRTYDGIVFASELEMQYYRDVVLPQVGSGSITKCDLQIEYELQPKFVYNGKSVRPITYVADFVITYADGRKVVIDTKGAPDAKAKLKRKMFWFKYPDIEYQWVCYSKIDGGWRLYEDVQKARAERRKLKQKAKAAEQDGQTPGLKSTKHGKTQRRNKGEINHGEEGSTYLDQCTGEDCQGTVCSNSDERLVWCSDYD